MNILDLRTVFIGFTVSNAICAVVMAFLWLQNRRRFPQLSFWLANFIMQFLAVFLITLRGLIPDLISIVVANILSFWGIILLYAGMQRFAGKVNSQRHNYMLLAVFFLLLMYFTYWQPSLRARNHSYAVIAILLSLQIAWFTIYRMDVRYQPYSTSVGMIFIVFSLINFARLFSGLYSPVTNDIFQSGFFETLVILIFQMSYIGITFSLFLLINQCLVGELASDLAERRQMELSLQERLAELETVNTLSTSLRLDLQKEIQQKITVQELLAAEKELLSTTLMSIADGVIVTDRNGLVILFNRAAETITGYTCSEAIQGSVQTVFRLHHAVTLEPVVDVIGYLFRLEEEQKKRIDYRSPQIMTKTEERVLVAGSITPLRSAEKDAVGYVIVFQNVNEKQKVEAQNVLSQKMEAIGQLAAGIAHEINTPIQYIGDNVKFLSKAFTKYSETLAAYQHVTRECVGRILQPEDLDGLDALVSQKKVPYYLDEIPRAIQEAMDGIERVRKIVLAMREFSHPSGREKNFSDINHGIETTSVISRNEWKYCADMELNLDGDLPPVYCQIDEINQVILNMIVNAAQAIQEKAPQGSGQKGRISIGTCRQNDKILITVQDTGVGIPPEIRARIFDPFFTTKGVGKGTGQGLSMAHNIIVNKHHGIISVDSEPGQTTFTIELPIDSSELEQS